MYIRENETKKRRTVVIELGPNTMLGFLQIAFISFWVFKVITYPIWMVFFPLICIFALNVMSLVVTSIKWVLYNTFYFKKRS